MNSIDDQKHITNQNNDNNKNKIENNENYSQRTYPPYHNLTNRKPPIHYTVKRFNYASAECGGKVLRSNPEARVCQTQNQHLIINSEILKI
jgi:hypothetical protein